MGNNGNKETKEDKTYVNDHQPKSFVSNTIHDSDSQYESESELPKKPSPPKKRHDKLKNPYNERPLELSWLQQNHSHDNYNRMNHRHQHSSQHHHHQHHHHQQQQQQQHQHHQEHLRRKPLAINRWPKDDDQIEKQKGKSFIEEYIHQ
ncbi:unnamed protein product [Rotaria sp. Silwood1]|nr:unnamed protein product [Rotaria sp. Silwood1]CAF0749103.1 unnamed protein product [Rotaria sp. Silwood1]CAF3329221.1 unnamed protein product [Rotaria sp. Silwood1]CAF3356737.1 unnamed protein product [Rotaria sp. Silwood1]CAF3357509.1 unnamed protein product [Rotaria sp. Silwood1]